MVCMECMGKTFVEIPETEYRSRSKAGAFFDYVMVTVCFAIFIGLIVMIFTTVR